MSLKPEEKLGVLLTEGLKTLNYPDPRKMTIERESDTEVWVHLPDLGVSVFFDAEGGVRKGIGREIKVPSYQVYTVTWDAATREQPEDMNLTMRREFLRIDDAVAEVFALAVKDRIYDMIEAVSIGLDL